MKKIVVKYSKLSPELKKIVREKLENEDVKFFNFPYQGNLEEGFLLEGMKIDGEAVNYLVIVDIEKKSKYKPSDDDDDDSDDDMDDLPEVEGAIPDVDEDEFKDDEVEDKEEIEEFDDDDDDDEPVDEDFGDDDDEK